MTNKIRIKQTIKWILILTKNTTEVNMWRYVVMWFNESTGLNNILNIHYWNQSTTALLCVCFIHSNPILNQFTLYILPSLSSILRFLFPTTIHQKWKCKAFLSMNEFISSSHTHVIKIYINRICTISCSYICIINEVDNLKVPKMCEEKKRKV